MAGKLGFARVPDFDLGVRKWLFTIRQQERGPLARVDLTFYAFGGKAPEYGSSGEIVLARRLPSRFRVPSGYVGHISYSISEPKGGFVVATSVDYYPKEGVDDVRRLGYWIEINALSHLAKRGVLAASTTRKPSEARKCQIQKVGLVPGKPYAIYDWMRHLAKGFKSDEDAGIRLFELSRQW